MFETKRIEKVRGASPKAGTPLGSEYRAPALASCSQSGPSRPKSVMANWFETTKRWARAIKRDVVALWIAARDQRTPIAAKIVAGAVAAYALSPIDLIPDFIPVLGYLDDLLIVPLGIALAVRLVPTVLMNEYREDAARREDKPISRGGLIAVVEIWIMISALAGWFFWRQLAR